MPSTLQEAEAIAWSSKELEACKVKSEILSSLRLPFRSRIPPVPVITAVGLVTSDTVT